MTRILALQKLKVDSVLLKGLTTVPSLCSIRHTTCHCPHNN